MKLENYPYDEKSSPDDQRPIRKIPAIVEEISDNSGWTYLRLKTKSSAGKKIITDAPVFVEIKW